MKSAISACIIGNHMMDVALDEKTRFEHGRPQAFAIRGKQSGALDAFRLELEKRAGGEGSHGGQALRLVRDLCDFAKHVQLHRGGVQVSATSVDGVVKIFANDAGDMKFHTQVGFVIRMNSDAERPTEMVLQTVLERVSKVWHTYLSGAEHSPAI